MVVREKLSSLLHMNMILCFLKVVGNLRIVICPQTLSLGYDFNFLYYCSIFILHKFNIIHCHIAIQCCFYVVIKYKLIGKDSIDQY